MDAQQFFCGLQGVHGHPIGSHCSRQWDNRMAAQHLPRDLVRPNSGLVMKNWRKKRKTISRVKSSHSDLFIVSKCFTFLLPPISIATVFNTKFKFSINSGTISATTSHISRKILSISKHWGHDTAIPYRYLVIFFLDKAHVTHIELYWIFYPYIGFSNLNTNEFWKAVQPVTIEWLEQPSTHCVKRPQQMIQNFSAEPWWQPIVAFFANVQQCSHFVQTEWVKHIQLARRTRVIFPNL